MSIDLQNFNCGKFDQQYDYEILPMPRKGKNTTKKISKNNNKKTKKIKNGSDYKIFNIEQHTSYLYSLTEPCNVITGYPFCTCDICNETYL